MARKPALGAGESAAEAASESDMISECQLDDARDTYGLTNRFAGCRPGSTVLGTFGDPHVRVTTPAGAQEKVGPPGTGGWNHARCQADSAGRRRIPEGRRPRTQQIQRLAVRGLKRQERIFLS